MIFFICRSRSFSFRIRQVAVWGQGPDKIHSMNIIRLLICLSCLYAIFIQVLRIIWLYFPSFIRRTSLYKMRESRKTEMLLYYILAIVAMLYYTIVTAEEYFKPYLVPGDH